MASLNLPGNWPDCNEVLIIFVIADKNTSILLLTSQVGMESSEQDLVADFLTTWSTSSSLTSANAEKLQLWTCGWAWNDARDASLINSSGGHF